jgi:uncharacterized protein
MKRSRYSLSIDKFPAPGKTLYFSTRTQAQVAVGAELRAVIEGLPARADNGSADTPLAKLRDLGIVVDDGTDETADLETWFARLNAGDDALKPTILTTYACNLACVYCVEEGVRDPVFMDADTARRAAAYVLERARRQGVKRIALTFYGGEPLLNPEALRTIASSLKTSCPEAGLAFGFGLITNGTLLSAALVDELTGLGLAGIKVTLDGDRAAHDARRPFGNGRGSYDEILARIEAVADRTGVEIGCNVDDGNESGIMALLDELVRRGLARRIRKITFKPVSPSPADRRGLAPTAELSCGWAEPAAMRRLATLRAAAITRGLPVEEGIGVHVCDALSGDSAFAIDPTGVLYRCAGFVGHPEFSAGDIGGATRDDGLRSGQWRRCADCPLVPLCGDGCPFGAWVRFGDPGALHCNREALETLVAGTIRVNYGNRAR